ncbi:uncharacterized protein LOC135168255 [Diachasmimorpha longicaudata]|uniref:uncharacterized protein LOC135168255 n=1 Tax=Diachasmimorpha longicaudata TaxID=58733 RepID=UPI0030B912A8
MRQVTLVNNPPTDQIILSAMVNLMDKNNQPVTCRVLLDTASTANFITERLVRKLGIATEKYSVPVGALNGLSTNTNHLVTVKLQATNRRYEKEFRCLSIPEICGLIPTETIPREMFSIPAHVKLADPEFYKPRPVDMLLGSGPSLSLFTSGQYHLSNNGEPNIILQRTRLGWVVGGSASNNSNKKQVFVTNLTFDLTKFWEIEHGPENKPWSPEEKLAEEFFKKHYTRDSNGRAVVALPFKADSPHLGESKELALRRFRSLECRLDKNPALREQYRAVMKEYLTLNHMSKASDIEIPGYYLPHHAVLKESSSTTKDRVVFDGSAKTSTGVSLNESLLVGPTIQDDIFSLIVRFRAHQYALTGDIEKMYRQFLICPEDRRFQRVLWRDEKDQIATYELNTVTFGLSAAPFLAIRCLQQLAQDEATHYPIASQILQRDMYVDDLLTGFDSLEEAIEARDQITQLLQKGGLNLRQWASNESKLLEGLAEEEINKKLQLDGDKTLKTLGIFWNSENDSINYTARQIEIAKTTTKRKILSEIAAIFDPLGLLGPIILKAKNIIQQLWSAKLDWDEPIPLYILTIWTDFCNQLSLINDLKFERKILIKNSTRNEIHGFCDASETGFGACIYLKSIDALGNVKINLLCSKSRVAPLKSISIPRLELCGALILSNLCKSVHSSLSISIARTILWTDSMIVLHWIHTPPHTLKTFVQNRISEIQSLTQNAEWKHVSSGDNPADALSRGQLPIEFTQNELWTTGPVWLTLPEGQWPEQPMQAPVDDQEQRKITCLNSIVDLSLFDKFKSFDELIRVFVYCYRFITKKQNRRWQGWVTLAELKETELYIIKLVQQQALGDEIRVLQQHRTDTRTHSTRLKQLNPFVNDQGVLRVGGRLQNAKISFGQQQPIVLPQTGFITKLIISKYHLMHCHSGIQNTLYATRQFYWILNGRSTIRNVIRKCSICCRANPPPTNYIMGNLPGTRVAQTMRPFVNVGVDYCGPFLIKEKKYRNRSKIKVYVAVFICLSVKAVHFELVSDLTTAGFLAALDRFIARRGKPVIIESDNGTNFTGANNELKTIIRKLQEPQQDAAISRALAKQGIQWKFTPPLSPHFGGVWEAAVKSFKHHLIRVTKNSLFTFEELNTLIIKIEGILNSRPISSVSSDPNDLQALSPGHFLIGTPLTSTPEHDLSDEKINRLTRWEMIQRMKQDFWSRWNKEYLNELNIRKKWTTGTHHIVKDSIVLLKEDNIPPMQWKLGRALTLHPGADHIVRVVTVKTANGIYKRNVKCLANVNF